MIYGIYIVLSLLTTTVQAITLTLPPADGNRDVILVGPTQVQARGDLVIEYVQKLNEYLRFAMVVLLFALLVWMGFKLITNDASDQGAGKKVLKDGILSAGAGILIIMLSYTIVRLVINLL